MVDYYEAKLVDPRECIQEEIDGPTITINGKTTSIASEDDISKASSARKIKNEMPQKAKAIQTTSRAKKSASTKKISSNQIKNNTLNNKGTKKSQINKNVKSANKNKKVINTINNKKAKSILNNKDKEKSHRVKVAKATMATDFDVPAVEEIKWTSEKLASKRTDVKVKSSKPLVLVLILVFIGAMGIVYQYSLVNSSFMEKSEMEKQLAEIDKQNEQLEVKLESATNIKKIEQEAKEKLGMQKLDNNQKVYINLEKSDYVASSTETAENESWIKKLIDNLFNK